MIGSNGSYPLPPPPQVLLRRLELCHTFFAYYFFFLPILRTCFLILVSTFQGDESEGNIVIPGLQRLKRYRGRWPPGFGDRYDPWRR
jgi:hypothetical protein